MTLPHGNKTFHFDVIFYHARSFSVPTLKVNVSKFEATGGVSQTGRDETRKGIPRPHTGPRWSTMNQKKWDMLDTE